VEQVAASEACTYRGLAVFPAHSWRVKSNAGVRLPINSAAQHRVQVTVYIAQHITTCRSEAARAGSGLSTSQHHGERRSPADTVGDLGGAPASIANETSAKARSFENAGHRRSQTTWQPRRSAAHHTPDAVRQDNAGRACTSFALNADAWKAKRPRREQPVRPARLHRPRDRRRTGGEHGDHKVVRPTRIRAPGSRYARRALGPRRISAGGLFHD
jgi:hypothetical protein